jgi:hypothetical protein
MNIAALLVLVHVLTAFWFVAGLVGRSVVIGRASSASRIETVVELMETAGRFERLMVIPGSFAVLVAGIFAAIARGLPLFGGPGVWWLPVSLLLFVSAIPLVPLVFLPRGRVFEAALEDARRRGAPTDALRSAFADRAVAAARAYEAVSVFVVITLMVTKPF